MDKSENKNHETNTAEKTIDNNKKPNQFLDAFILALVIGLSALVMRVLANHYIIPWMEHLWGIGRDYASYWQIAVIVVIGAIMLFSLWGYFKRLVGGMYLATINILFLAATTAFGTFVLQGQTQEFYTQSMGETCSQVVMFFHWNDVFHSWWYASYYILLFAGVLRAMSKRSFNRKMLGFQVTHLGLLIVISSVWFDYYSYVKGFIPLREGDFSNVVQLTTNTGQIIGEKKLDFSILLDKFETKYHDPDYKIYIQKYPDGYPKQLQANFMETVIQMVPKDLKDVLTKAYTKKGDQYVFNPEYKNNTKELEVITNLVRSFGYEDKNYQVKDVASYPIKKGDKQDIYTTNLNYTITDYYPNYESYYIPLPYKISFDMFENKLLSRLTKEIDRRTLVEAYSKNNKEYLLNENYYYNKENNKKLLDLFKNFDEDFLLSEINGEHPVLTYHEFLEGKLERQFYMMTSKSSEPSYIDRFTKAEVVLKNEPSQKEIENILNLKEYKHTLLLKNDPKAAIKIGLKEGTVYNIPGSDYKLKFVKFFNHFYMDARTKQYTNRSYTYENPAIEVQLIDPTGKDSVHTVLYSNSPEIDPVQKLPKIKGLTGFLLQYKFAPEKIVIAAKEKLVYSKDDSNAVIKQELKFNTPFSLKGSPIVLDFRQMLKNSESYMRQVKNGANIAPKLDDREIKEKVISLLTSEKDKAFVKGAYTKRKIGYSLKDDYRFDPVKSKRLNDIFNAIKFEPMPLNPVLMVEVKNHDKSQTFNFALATIYLDVDYRSEHYQPFFAIPNSNYMLRMESRQEEQAKFWKSHLVVLDDKGNPVPDAQSVVEVNYHMEYGGFRFYQTDAKKDDPSYSGIGVSREPALTFIYLGFYVLAIGMFIMFYIKPKKKPGAK